MSKSGDGSTMVRGVRAGVQKTPEEEYSAVVGVRPRLEAPCDKSTEFGRGLRCAFRPGLLCL